MSVTPTQALRKTIEELLIFLKDHVFATRQDKADADMVLYHIQRKSDDDIINLMREHVVPHSDLIRSGDLSVVDAMCGRGLFSKLPEDRGQHLSDLLSQRKPGVSDDQIDELFSYFCHLLDIMNKVKRR